MFAFFVIALSSTNSHKNPVFRNQAPRDFHSSTSSQSMSLKILSSSFLEEADDNFDSMLDREAALPTDRLAHVSSSSSGMIWMSWTMVSFSFRRILLLTNFTSRLELFFTYWMLGKQTYNFIYSKNYITFCRRNHFILNVCQKSLFLFILKLLTRGFFYSFLIYIFFFKIDYWLIWPKLYSSI